MMELNDWRFVALFLRALVAALFLVLGTGTVVMWREEMSRAAPGSSRPAWAFPVLALVFYAAAGTFLRW